jgi:hypothetical protein
MCGASRMLMACPTSPEIEIEDMPSGEKLILEL